MVGAFAYSMLNRKPAAPTTTKADTAILSVPEGRAGQVGDLIITSEAMKLAEITLGRVESRQVEEPLFVSGSVKVGGDQLAKVTPVSAGKVVKLLAGEGDDVRAGQTLAILQSPDLASAQSIYTQSAARVQARQATLERQKQLANLGQFSGPQLEEARSRLAEAQRDLGESERTVADEEATLEESQAAMSALESSLRQAETELEVSRKEYERAVSLFEMQIISRKDLDRTTADFRKAEADVDSAKSAINQGKARISGAEKRLSASQQERESARSRVQVAREGLEREEKVFKGRYNTNREVVDTESALREAKLEQQGAADAVRLLGGTPGEGSSVPLKAPISGRVQARAATLGESIDPEHAAFTLVNINQVWAELSIPAGDAAAVKQGDRIALMSEAVPGQIFEARVSSVGAVADESTRAIRVRATLENPSQKLKAGMYVTGEVTTDVRHDRTIVPEDALQDHQGKPTVYISKPTEGEFEVRHVLLGVRKDGWVEITEGVKPGEKVAVSGTFYLKSEALKSSLSDGCCAPGA